MSIWVELFVWCLFAWCAGIYAGWWIHTWDERDSERVLECDPPAACDTHGRCWTHSWWADGE